MDFLNLYPEAFGLDISDLSLKIVKLKSSKNFWGQEERNFELACYGAFPIAPGIIEKGEIKNKEALAKTIKEALRKVKGEKLKTNYVIASLPEEKAFLEIIPMPKIEEKQLKKAVRFEAENYIPLPIETVYLDSQIVPPLKNSSNHLEVLIAALPKKIIDTYVSCLSMAGLTPLAMEIESQSISRALIKNETSANPLLLIDFGALRTGLIVFFGHSLQFTTSIPISSQKITEAISKNLKIDFKKAEKMKLRYGLETPKVVRLRGEKEGKFEKTITEDKQIFEAIIPILTDLTEQIKKYMDYYQSHTKQHRLSSNGKTIEKILFCGGGANLNGLCRFLSDELKIPVVLGNPWINVSEKPPLPLNESLKYTTAIGLALRGIMEKSND